MTTALARIQNAIAAAERAAQIGLAVEDGQLSVDQARSSRP
ncbi:hypothetical protein [Micromonospora sp. NPDC005113]